MAFGVGNYKDLPPPSPSPFTHQLTPTPAAASVTAAIAAWVAAGGGDRFEGHLLALDQLAQPICGLGGAAGQGGGSLPRRANKFHSLRNESEGVYSGVIQCRVNLKI